MFHEEAEEGDLVVNLFGVERMMVSMEIRHCCKIWGLGFLGGGSRRDGKNEKLGSPEFLFLELGTV